MSSHLRGGEHTDFGDSIYFGISGRLFVCKISPELVGGLLLFVWFGSLRPSQQLWSCHDGQFTLLSWASLTKQLTSTS